MSGATPAQSRRLIPSVLFCRLGEEATGQGRLGGGICNSDEFWVHDSDRTGQANIDWVEGFADGMRPYTTEYAYQNFIGRSQADPAHAYYGDNLDRLIAIKSRHDPDDFFQFAQSVPLRQPMA